MVMSVAVGWDVRKERGVDTLTKNYWELAEYLEHIVNASADLTWPENQTLITSYYTAAEQALYQRIVGAQRAQVSRNLDYIYEGFAMCGFHEGKAKLNCYNKITQNDTRSCQCELPI